MAEINKKTSQSNPAVAKVKLNLKVKNSTNSSLKAKQSTTLPTKARAKETSNSPSPAPRTVSSTANSVASEPVSSAKTLALPSGLKKVKPDTAKRPIIQVTNLVKKYGDFIAVDDISFVVNKGEIFGILGPNGAGKTTTLEIIETILPKTKGKVLVDGLDTDVYPDQVKNIIGVQLQSTGFYPKITLIETLEMFADIYNVQAKPLQILKDFNLLEKANKTVEELSGGQKQRFSIATTLVADPEVIFLDEPTTGLDPQARRNLWDMILSLKEMGKTIVITTHYMDEAEELCDRIAIMDAGKILEINTADNFIDELLDRGFVRPQPKKGATLEDVFLDLTGKNWRD